MIRCPIGANPKPRITMILAETHIPLLEDPAPGVGTVVLEEERTANAAPYFVILYNDENHALDEVVRQVQKATGHSLSAAFEITMEAHTKGRAVCYSGDVADCERVAGVLREIRLTVEIDHYPGA